VLKPDQQIIAEIHQGNPDTFRWVFNAYYEKLCQYAFTILKDMDEAEDIVQAMFIKIWEQRKNLEVKQSMQSYLFKSVYHKCINLIEHRGIKQKYQEHGKHVMKNEVQWPETFPHELEDNIKSVINKLPPQCRTIFMMSRYEELRYAEIAAKLNISVNTIENQISKALKILREELKDVLI
jgi:RNA polymerase sigma-70 factor, ECF subfamily